MTTEADPHWFVYIDNASNVQQFLAELLNGRISGKFHEYETNKMALFSKTELQRYIQEEQRHDIKILTPQGSRNLNTLSSGEQKKLFFNFLMAKQPNVLVLDQPFDHLDENSQLLLRDQLQTYAQQTTMIQLASRIGERLPFITQVSALDNNQLRHFPNLEAFHRAYRTNTDFIITERLPEPLHTIDFEGGIVVEMKNINVSYDKTPILDSITWTIEKQSFWQLTGENGSGKTTLLSMITGENVSGYGQELYIFGKKKGSGESVWDLKRKIGYFRPDMLTSFSGNPKVVDLLVSGFFDTLGLNQKPSDLQLKTAKKWLRILKLDGHKNIHFRKLSNGQQRLVFVARAMIKQPPLLILDEPLEGLDDNNIKVCVALINKMAQESKTAIIYVSHRHEPLLKAAHNFQLRTSEAGSTGHVI